jgi:hypothetical protein
MTATGHMRVRRGRRERGLTIPIVLILVAIILSVFHRQSLEVTPFEWALGGFLAFLCVWAAVRLLHAGLRMRTTLFWFLLFAVWSTFNVVIAMVEGVSPVTWVRFAFPAFLLPAIGVLSTFELNTYARMRAGYLSLMLLGVGVVAVSLFHLAYVTVSDVVDLQVLRRYGGDYFSTFSLCLTLPLVLDGSPRKRIVKIGLWLCLGLSVLGVLFSFTRTYWISWPAPILAARGSASCAFSWRGVRWPSASSSCFPPT